MKSIILHIVNDGEHVHVLCGTPLYRLKVRVHLSRILKGTSLWTLGVPPGYKRCEKCVKKLAKDYPELLLMELRSVVL
jgi:hypothetical protein